MQGIVAAGIDQINITARQVAEAHPFYSVLLLGGGGRRDRQDVPGAQTLKSGDADGVGILEEDT